MIKRRQIFFLILIFLVMTAVSIIIAANLRNERAGEKDTEEKIEEVQDLTDYFDKARTCDFRIVLQGEFANQKQQNLLENTCIKFDAISVNSAVIKCKNTDTIQDFIEYSEEEIEKSIINFAKSNDIDTSTTKAYFLLNCENPVHPKSWGYNLSWGNEEELNEVLQTEYLLAMKRRVDIFREVMPNAIISIGPTIRGQWRGRFLDVISDRVKGLQRAGDLGVFDSVSCFEPRVFHSQGQDDIDQDNLPPTWMENMTRQALNVASMDLKNSSGGHLPLCVTSSILIFNSNSANDGQAITAEIARRQAEIVMEYDSVLLMNWWSGDFYENIHPQLFEEMSLCELTCE